MVCLSGSSAKGAMNRYPGSTSLVAGIVMLRRGGARSERERYCQSAAVNVSRVESVAVIAIDCLMFTEY